MIIIEYRMTTHFIEKNKKQKTSLPKCYFYRTQFFFLLPWALTDSLTILLIKFENKC